MKIEELAVHLAQDMGRGIFIGDITMKLILKACLNTAGLEPTDANVVRLQDMIENLTAEVWKDWHEKKDMAAVRWHEPRPGVPS